MTKAGKIAAYIIFLVITVLFFILIYINRAKIINILTPLLIALFIAYVVNPPVSFLARRGVPRGTAIIMVYSLFITLTAAAAVFLLPEIAKNTVDLTEKLPDLFSRYQQIFDDFISSIRYSRWSPDVKEAVFQEIQNGIGMLENLIEGVLGRLFNILVDTVSMVLQILIALVLAYYLLKDGRLFSDAFLKMLPRKLRRGTVQMFKDINMILSRFIQGQLLVAFIVSMVEIAGLLIVGLDYAFIFGIFGGITNMIPYFGPYIGAAPAVLVAFLESPAKGGWTMLVFIIAQQIDNNLVAPKVIQGKLGLHPVVTILAILAGGRFFGLAGLLLAVPVTAIMKVVLKRVIDAVA